MAKDKPMTLQAAPSASGPPLGPIAYSINMVVATLDRGDVRIQGVGGPVLKALSRADGVPGSVMLDLSIQGITLEVRDLEIAVAGNKAAGLVCRTPDVGPMAAPLPPNEQLFVWGEQARWASDMSSPAGDQEHSALSTPPAIDPYRPLREALAERPTQVRIEGVSISGARQIGHPDAPGGRSKPAVALRIFGDFALAEVLRCRFEDVTTDIWRRDENDPGGQARGLEAVWNPQHQGRHIRRLVVRDSTFRNIQLLEPTTGLPSPARPAANVDGMYLGKVGMPNAAMAEIRGCTFENCHGRSIKGQLFRLQVSGSTFIRSALTGDKEIDAQFGGLTATDNTFRYSGFDVDAIMQLGLRWDAQGRMAPRGPLVVNDNRIFIEDIPPAEARATPVVGIALGPEGVDPAEPADAFFESVSASRNIVTGVTKFFASIASPAGAHLWIEGNQITGTNPDEGAFLQLRRAPGVGLPRATFSGEVRFNSASREDPPVREIVPRPAQQDDRNLQGLTWRGNGNIRPWVEAAE